MTSPFLSQINHPNALVVLGKIGISACENVRVPDIIWGFQDQNDDTNSSLSSENLRITGTVTTSNDDCDNQYEAALFIPCTSSSPYQSTARSGKGSCHGDEGSSLVFNCGFDSFDVLLGVCDFQLGYEYEDILVRDNVQRSKLLEGIDVFDSGGFCDRSRPNPTTFLIFVQVWTGDGLD